MWEPLSDTRRLFAPTGVAPTSSPYINADLRRLDEARSWQEVATRLQQLHRTIYDEVPLIPLWQTYDFAAVRVNLKNVAQRPIWLYGDIMQWQLAAEVTLGGAK
jgi:ABC-type oligopeptide transport system substrate-binding subunit